MYVNYSLTNKSTVFKEAKNRSIIILAWFKLFDVTFALDFVGPLLPSKNGCKYTTVGVDLFSRWPVAMPCLAADSHTAVSFL
jgi:hypothetical protein